MTRSGLIAAWCFFALSAATPALGENFLPGQATRGQAGREFAATPRPRFDCSRAPNPANCETKRKEFRSQLLNAQSACESLHGEAHHNCMIKTMCQQTRDPQLCETIARRRAEFRREIREACGGRAGDELRDCIRNRMGYDEPMPLGDPERSD